MINFFQRLWTALDSYAQHRAAGELRRLASTYTDPALKRKLIETANELRK